jgi:hypothetical protein
MKNFSGCTLTVLLRRVVAGFLVTGALVALAPGAFGAPRGGCAASAQEDETKGAIAGKVIAIESDKPIAKAKIRATRTSTKEIFEAETDESGVFQVRSLDPGTYILEVEAAGRSSVRVGVLQSVQAKRTTSLRDPVKMGVERSASVIRGAVFNPRGLSMPGARVVIERVSSQDGSLKPGKVGEYVTNAAGEFAFRLPGANSVYRVMASAKGFKSKTQEVDVQKDEARNIAFSLEPEN